MTNFSATTLLLLETVTVVTGDEVLHLVGIFVLLKDHEKEFYILYSQPLKSTCEV